MAGLMNWQKSSYSGADGPECVQVARDGHTIALRESDDPDTILTTTPAQLAALIGAVRAGDFDTLTA